MKLVVGLGNPGAEHKDNRHNVGYKVAEKFATTKWCLLVPATLDSEPYASLACANIDGKMVACLKPIIGMMNNSGKPTRFFSDLFDVATSDIIVVYDDMDLEPGEINVRPTSGSAHHNGIKSLINHLGKGFSRVRVGVGRPKRGNSIDHVLGDFTPAEQKKMEQAYTDAVLAVEDIVLHGVDFACNKYNKKE